MDYYGLSYDVVEVDPVLRRETKWSPYRKVPIILAKVKGGYQPVTDSSVIVSLLASYLQDPSKASLEELNNYYPIIGMNDENGKYKEEVVNKYFLMYGSTIPRDRTLNDIA